jgi:hypothetical protein
MRQSTEKFKGHALIYDYSEKLFLPGSNLSARIEKFSFRDFGQSMYILLIDVCRRRATGKLKTTGPRRVTSQADLIGSIRFSGSRLDFQEITTIQQRSMAIRFSKDLISVLVVKPKEADALETNRIEHRG